MKSGDITPSQVQGLLLDKVLEDKYKFQVFDCDVNSDVWKPHQINVTPKLVILDVPYGVTNESWDQEWETSVCFVTPPVIYITDYGNSNSPFCRILKRLRPKSKHCAICSP